MHTRPGPHRHPTADRPDTADSAPGRAVLKLFFEKLVSLSVGLYLYRSAFRSLSSLHVFSILVFTF